MVSTAFDEDTDSGSINLDELEELATSGGETRRTMNQLIASTKLAAKENKCHMESWDEVTSPRMAQIQLTAMRKQSTQ